MGAKNVFILPQVEMSLDELVLIVYMITCFGFIVLQENTNGWKNLRTSWGKNHEDLFSGTFECKKFLWDTKG